MMDYYIIIIIIIMEDTLAKKKHSDTLVFGVRSDKVCKDAMVLGNALT